MLLIRKDSSLARVSRAESSSRNSTGNPFSYSDRLPPFGVFRPGRD